MGDVVEAVEVGDRRVDLDNDLGACQSHEAHVLGGPVLWAERLVLRTLSAIWMSSGVAPTDAPGTMLPSGLMQLASTTATSSELLGRSLV